MEELLVQYRYRYRSRTTIVLNYLRKLSFVADSTVQLQQPLKLILYYVKFYYSYCTTTSKCYYNYYYMQLPYSTTVLMYYVLLITDVLRATVLFTPQKLKLKLLLLRSITVLLSY